MQIHLDPIGGWSGDMFVAALLDAFPTFWPAVEAAVACLALGTDAVCGLAVHNDGILKGRRFLVAADESHHGHDHSHNHGPFGHHHHHSHHDHKHDPSGHSHGHRAWAEIRAQLMASPLDPVVKSHAIGIFELLAEAEAQVHGLSTDDVEFHEVGAVDSIVDIVAAAQLIALIGASRWTTSPLPLGSGRIKTAHGLLPVPAPATALLLLGLPTIDDGIPGERVTPTGAAVARYLVGNDAKTAPNPRRLIATGTGFGTRVMSGVSNCLRVLAFDESDPALAAMSDQVLYRQLGVIHFEVDDQSSEDLTQGLDLLRAMDGVHDVSQGIMVGKKGRIATHVQVLVSAEHLQAAVLACFEETTTIGLRYDLINGAVLSRRHICVDSGEERLRVKVVSRPNGVITAKTEADDVADQSGHVNRTTLRRLGERAALAKIGDDSDEESD